MFTENMEAPCSGKHVVLRSGVTYHWRRIRIVVNEKFSLQPKQTSSRCTLEAADAVRGDIQGCFSIGNVLMTVVPFLRGLVLL